MGLLIISGPEKLRISILDDARNTVYRDTRIIDQAGIVFKLKDFTGLPTFKVITESGYQVVVKKLPEIPCSKQDYLSCFGKIPLNHGQLCHRLKLAGTKAGQYDVYQQEG